MSCEAWKWLAIVTGAATIAGYEVYQWRVFGIFWPRSPAGQLARHERLKPYVRWWVLCGLAAVVSLVVYLAHCAG